MKKLIFIFVLLCSGIMFGQFAEAPQYQFGSTSSYQYIEVNRQYTIPISEVQQPFCNYSSYTPNDQYVGVRRAPDYPPADPGMPIGDALIPLIVFSIIYVMIKIKTKKNK